MSVFRCSRLLRFQKTIRFTTRIYVCVDRVSGEYAAQTPRIDFCCFQYAWLQRQMSVLIGVVWPISWRFCSSSCFVSPKIKMFVPSSVVKCIKKAERREKKKDNSLWNLKRATWNKKSRVITKSI